jgi:hypothetical protein
MNFTTEPTAGGKWRATFTDPSLPPGLELTFSIEERTEARLLARATNIVKSALTDVVYRKLAKQPHQEVLPW